MERTPIGKDVPVHLGSYEHRDDCKSCASSRLSLVRVSLFRTRFARRTGGGAVRTRRCPGCGSTNLEARTSSKARTRARRRPDGMPPACAVRTSVSDSSSFRCFGVFSFPPCQGHRHVPTPKTFHFSVGLSTGDQSPTPNCPPRRGTAHSPAPRVEASRESLFLRRGRECDCSSGHATSGVVFVVGHVRETVSNSMAYLLCAACTNP